jgi:hypothetical protein
MLMVVDIVSIGITIIGVSVVIGVGLYTFYKLKFKPQIKFQKEFMIDNTEVIVTKILKK